VEPAGALEPFTPAVREWFTTSFPEPTPAQAQGWPAIAGGDHTLILAPTGSGKTLAAFLWGLDRCSAEPPPEDRTHRTRVLYVSPLRALAVDVERNLRAPLQGIALAAERLGESAHLPTVGMRTGDTPADERRTLVRHPPDVLITTPESLFLMLTSQAREALAGVRWVIIDEIHAMAATKRGAHLSLSLERLDELVRAGGGASPQRIGLSATQRPLDEIARFLGGYEPPPPGGGEPKPRTVTIVDAGVRKPMEVEVIVPVEDMGRLGEVIDEPVSGPAAAGLARASIWPAVHPRLLDLILEHRSTLIFVNARRLAERLAARLNELHEARQAEAEGREARYVAGEQYGSGAAPELVRAHHGSLSRVQRLDIEDQLKEGRLRALVATSSLELGIDMGAIDLVVQVESPGSVASGLQRIGRAGHQVGEPSRGKVFPKHRGDLVEAAVVVRRMREGAIEETRYPRNAIDVLAQQVVAMCAMDDWPVADLAAVVRRAAGFAELTDEVLASVLDLLSGRYPSEEFAELAPRLVWDRAVGDGSGAGGLGGTLRARRGAQRVAVTNAGTIPDRGLFGVFLPDGARVGELDEEMVYESREGETFLLGASTWRIQEITHDRVVVVPAPGEPGKMPFWHGDRPGRPLELGRAVGAFLREVRGPGAVERLQSDYGLDPWAANNLVAYVEEQAEATGHVPDDRTIVVERFKDEIGDWRVCILSPYGARVHAPLAMAIEARLRERLDMEVQSIWSDDGIVLRLPESDDAIPLDDLVVDPDEVEELLLAALPDTALFAARFRENAARSLLLPRRRPGSRTPLWQQRQRSADLLKVASRYPQFPILLETTRECLRDVFDLPGLLTLLTDIRARRIRMVAVDTAKASPFASSLLFGWIAVYMYEGDAPLAERRAAALALDRDLLRELLGADELRELIDPEALATLELELQSLVEGRRARDADEAHDLLRRLGDLSAEELVVRCEAGADEVAGWVDQLVAERRAMRGRVAGEDRIAAAEDAARLRDALGVPVPPGLPYVFLEPVERPLDELVARFARTHGPFRGVEAARRLGTGDDRVAESLARLEEAGRVVRGEFRPEGAEREWCDDQVLRVLRRRSLAALRREVEPVDAATLGRFLPAWHGVTDPRRGLDALVDAVGRLQGAVLPASVLEPDVLAARVDGYRAAELDMLCSAGEVVWLGAGRLGTGDGRVALYLRDQVGLLAPLPADADDEARPADEAHEAIRELLATRGASFWPDLVQAVGTADERIVLTALWDLVWAGEVTNDTLAPLRAVLSGAARRRSNRGGRPRPGRLTRLGPPAGAGRWSLVQPLLEPVPSPTLRAHARATALLERHGVLAREAALAEGVEGGFAGVYGILKALEESGAVRRGYFVTGLGAAQFAVPGAVDRLRALRDVGEVGAAGDVAGWSANGHGGGGGRGPEGAGALALAATDPANPYGAVLSWPESVGEGRPARAAGAYVVLLDGELVAFLERGGKRLVTFPAGERSTVWVDALAGLVRGGRVRRLVIGHIDGEPAAASPLADELRRAGFADGYRGLTLQH
jgi:ATP-dependent helicase Lhr and Lhr-like helicase